MRINRYVAQATGMSRRTADKVIDEGRIHVDGTAPSPGQQISDDNVVTLDNQELVLQAITTIVLHKPVGYVCSRNGQGSATIYDLLPSDLHILKPIGRLDKDSSGLILLTNDGNLAQSLTHPSRQKVKRYEITLNKALSPLHRQMIQDYGVNLHDGNSKFIIERADDGSETKWVVVMHEGRNRQIRRTFESLGYGVADLHRTHFGEYTLNDLAPGKFQTTID